MANKISNLLTQLEEEDIKYYLVKGRDLYTEEEFSVLQNDNGSTKIGIILSGKIAGKGLFNGMKFYIDFIDGKGKPGVVESAIIKEEELGEINEKERVNSLYFTKRSSIVSSNLERRIGPDNEDKLTHYGYLEWTLDSAVTSKVGEVVFSIRIEGENNYKWQSNTAKFRVLQNLKEQYHLEKEIDENFVIQGREIVSVGDIKNILVKGDANSNEIFYKMNRYFQGIDMTEKNIRFVFLTPNKKDGDYQEGNETKYIYDDYFIFSWTPNEKVTESDGEVSYSIEFYELEKGAKKDDPTAKKVYSWSTLASIIVVEKNEAVTAKVDFVPNWVQSIENIVYEEIRNNIEETVNSVIETQVKASFDNALANLQQQIINKVNEELGKIDGKIASIQKDLKEDYDKFEISINKSVTSMTTNYNTYIANINKTLFNIEEEYKDSLDKYDAYINTVDDLSSRITGIETRIGELENTIANL